jgi:hypothetical protein
MAELKGFLVSPRTIIAISFLFIALTAVTAAAQVAPESPVLDVNPYLNLLALALVIERLLEIAVVLIPGIAEKRLKLEDDPPALTRYQLALQRATLAIGMIIGVVLCGVFKFGVLDEIFPQQMSPLNTFNHVVTGLIAGSGSEPVHQLVLIIISVRERLTAKSVKA